MRNIFELTKREQRTVIIIVIVLVTAALAQHHLETRSGARPERSTASLSPTVTPRLPAQETQTNQNEESLQEQR
jgi:hypothetical protein